MESRLITIVVFSTHLLYEYLSIKLNLTSKGCNKLVAADIAKRYLNYDLY